MNTPRLCLLALLFSLCLGVAPAQASTIISEPQDTVVYQTQTALLCVQTMGGPTTYQWQTTNNAGNFVNIVNVIGDCYAVPTSIISSRPYRVICTSPLNTVTSRVATVTVVPDETGPRVLSATVLEEPAENRTNRVQIVFDEGLLSSTVHWTPPNTSMLTNGTFRVSMLASNVVVGVSNSALLPGLTTNILTLYPTNWFYRSNYYIVFNRIREFKGNIIAPNSIIPIVWPSNATYGAITSPLPPFSLTNTITTTRLSNNFFQLSWPANAYGWALERSTNVLGPWAQVSAIFNSYVTDFSFGRQVFYRLHATQ